MHETNIFSHLLFLTMWVVSFGWVSEPEDGEQKILGFYT